MMDKDDAEREARRVIAKRAWPAKVVQRSIGNRSKVVWEVWVNVQGVKSGTVASLCVFRDAEDEKFGVEGFKTSYRDVAGDWVHTLNWAQPSRRALSIEHALVSCLLYWGLSARLGRVEPACQRAANRNGVLICLGG